VTAIKSTLHMTRCRTGTVKKHVVSILGSLFKITIKVCEMGPIHKRSYDNI